MARSSMVLWLSVTAALALAAEQPRTQPALISPPPLRAPDVRFEPTPNEVVDAMLKLGRIGPGDVVYDLGCGDGRIAIAAVQKAGAKAGVCIDIDPQRIAEGRENAQRARVGDRVQFRNEDLLGSDLRDATVVMLFLSPDLNLRLRPKLLKELRPGARIVSHYHNMGDWYPEQVVHVKVPGEGGARRVYLWTVPQQR